MTKKYPAVKVFKSYKVINATCELCKNWSPFELMWCICVMYKDSGRLGIKYFTCKKCVKSKFNAIKIGVLRRNIAYKDTPHGKRHYNVERFNDFKSYLVRNSRRYKKSKKKRIRIKFEF